MKTFIFVLLVIAFLLNGSFADETTDSTTPYAGEIVTQSSLSNQTRQIKPRKNGRSKSYVRASGKSGTIEVSGGDGFTSGNTVSLELHSIAEVGQRKPLSKTKSKKNGFQELRGGRNFIKSFSGLSFEFSESVENDTYPGTNISVSSVTFYTELKKDFNGTDIFVGRINITVYTFEEDAELSMGNETFNVTAGSVKTNYVFEDFTFCSNETVETGCDEESGEAIDVTLAVYGKSNKKAAKAKRPKEKLDTYSLGDTTALRMSKMVEIDGKVTDLPEDYPELKERGGISLLVCRIPKFDKVALYDPIIDLDLEGVELEEENDSDVDDDDDDDVDDDVDDGGENGSSAAQFSLFLVLSLGLTRPIAFGL